MVRYCLELPHGAMRHFPAGTYNEQISDWPGRKELQLMSVVHSVWYMFKYLKMINWGEGERKIAKWLMPDNNAPPDPTRRLDDILSVMWGSSVFAYGIVWKLRDIDNG
jgi:hypothetical protein